MKYLGVIQVLRSHKLAKYLPMNFDIRNHILQFVRVRSTLTQIIHSNISGKIVKKFIKLSFKL